MKSKEYIWGEKREIPFQGGEANHIVEIIWGFLPVLQLAKEDFFFSFMLLGIHSKYGHSE